jgi:hypothetical protein
MAVAALVSGCVSEPGIDPGVLQERVSALERSRGEDRTAIASVLRREEESRGESAEILRRVENLERVGLQAQVALADLRESLAHQRVEIEGRERALLMKRIDSLDSWIATLEAEKATIQTILGETPEPQRDHAVSHQP